MRSIIALALAAAISEGHGQQLVWLLEHPPLYTAGVSAKPEDLLAPTAARMYFQRLEAKMNRALTELDSARAVYLYMSMIVEFRALWFYELYQAALQRARHALSLKRVLGEERAHLIDMAERLEPIGDGAGAHAGEFLAVEKLLFARLLRGLERATA